MVDAHLVALSRLAVVCAYLGEICFEDGLAEGFFLWRVVDFVEILLEQAPLFGLQVAQAGI